MLQIVSTGMLVVLLMLLPERDAFSQETIDTIVVASEAMEGLAEEDGTGLYMDIVKSIYQLEGIGVQFVIYPYARSSLMTKLGKIDGMLGARQNEAEGLYFPVWHYGVNFISVIFSDSKKVEWSGEYSLRDKKVGMLRGANYNIYLYVPVNLYQVNKRIDGLSMLSLDRIDFFMDSRQDLQLELKVHASELNQRGFDPDGYRIENLVPIKQYLAFPDNQKGRWLAEMFDKGFARMLENGELKKLFLQYEGVPYPFH